ncbi:MAG: Ig domain-containing protein, partial [Acidobacteriota bacterium]
MDQRLFDDSSENLLSPLIDVVMNGMAAIFIILMVYLFVARPDGGSQPVRFLGEVEPPVVLAGQSFTFTLPVAGGAGPRRFELSGELPEGLVLEPLTGTIHGVVGRATRGIVDFPLDATVADQRDSDRRSFVLRCCSSAVPYNPERSPVQLLRQAERLPMAQVGRPYEAVLGSRGGVWPHRWSLRGGRLPP